MKIFERKTYCGQYRLLNNMLYLLFLDMIRIYHDYYLLLTITQQKFGKMNVRDQKRTFIIHSNFLTINKEIKKITPRMMKDFNSNLELHFYDIETSLLEQMKASIDAKEREAMGKSSASVSQTSSLLLLRNRQ